MATGVLRKFEGLKTLCQERPGMTTEHSLEKNLEGSPGEVLGVLLVALLIAHAMKRVSMEARKGVQEHDGSKEV